MLISLLFLTLGANAFNCLHPLLAICIAYQNAESIGIFGEVAKNPVVDHPLQMMMVVVVVVVMVKTRMCTSLTMVPEPSKMLNIY